MASGPLVGIRVVEFQGIGPGPFCARLLSDMGADVVRIDRKGAPNAEMWEVDARGRRSVALDLKTPEERDIALAVMSKADALIEPFRPGVMERLGLGPEIALERNPKLVYGRMTGWGQVGPLASAAGHDINYIALTGALHAMGQKDRPPAPPLNLVGDYGGGALYLALGICAALLEAKRSGLGQVIDCAMTDGAASLMGMFYGMHHGGAFHDERGSNLVDGAAHYYDAYETKDGKYVSIGSIEPQFYALLLEKTGLKDDPAFQAQLDQKSWPALSEKVAACLKMKTRDEWSALMEGADVCFAPVLSLTEAPNHPHNMARETFVEVAGVVQPNVAPRFSRTPSRVQGPPPAAGAHNAEVLKEWGVQ